MKSNNLKYTLILSVLVLSNAFSQSAYTEEKILWICRIDTNLKITYRYSNYTNVIEINGPLEMDTASAISGILTLSEGSFEQEQSTPQQKAEMMLTKTESKTPNVQQKEIKINSSFFSRQIWYYNTKSKPIVTFDGNCVNAKTKQLDRDLKRTDTQKKELRKKSEDSDKKFQPKTKTPVIGDRG